MVDFVNVLQSTTGKKIASLVYHCLVHDNAKRGASIFEEPCALRHESEDLRRELIAGSVVLDVCNPVEVRNYKKGERHAFAIMKIWYGLASFCPFFAVHFVQQASRLDLMIRRPSEA